MQLTFNFDHRYTSRVHCELSTSDLSTDDLSTDLATDLSTVSASDLSDDDDDSAGNEEVCSSDGVSPSGLTNGADVSLPDGTEVTPSDDTTEVPSSGWKLILKRRRRQRRGGVLKTVGFPLFLKSSFAEGLCRLKTV